MKVLLPSGSLNEEGCTYTAFSEVARTLEEKGIEAKIMHTRRNCIMGCIGCGAYSGNGNRCTFDGGIVSEVLDKMETTDGLIVGSPVYLASPTGVVLSLLDRIFMAGNKFYLKPAVAIAPARRVGIVAIIDVLSKYFSLAGTSIVSSSYYNVIHRHTPEETRQDEECVQIMRILRRSMTWMLRCMETDREKGLIVPEKGPKTRTSYIRQITCLDYRAKHRPKHYGQKM